MARVDGSLEEPQMFSDDIKMYISFFHINWDTQVLFSDIPSFLFDSLEFSIWIFGFLCLSTYHKLMSYAVLISFTMATELIYTCTN